MNRRSLCATNRIESGMNEADSNEKSSMTRSTSAGNSQRPGDCWVETVTRLTLRLELNPGHGNLPDKADEPGNNDVHEVPVETLSLDLQAAQTDLAGGSERVAQLLDRLDERIGRLVVPDTVDQSLELGLQLLGISLPLVVLFQQGLCVVEQALGLAVSGPRGNVARLVQESVDVVLQVVKVDLELVVLSDVVRGLDRISC